MAKVFHASGAKFWICEEGHLHVSLFDDAGEEIADGAVDAEQTVDVVFELVEALDDLYAEDDGEGGPDPEDTIGPTMGNA